MLCWKEQVVIKLGDKIVETLVPGDLFGEMALIDSTARSATAVATTDCKLAPHQSGPV